MQTLYDYTKIYPRINPEYMKTESIKEIKAEATTKRSYYILKYDKYGLDFISLKAHEFAYINDASKNRTNIEKAIIEAEIAISDENFIDAIKSTNIDREILASYLQLLSYLKERKKQNTVNEEDIKYEERANNVTKYLIKHFNKWFGKINPNIIINKASIILASMPERIESKSEKIINYCKHNFETAINNNPEIEHIYYNYNEKNGESFIKIRFILNCDTICTDNIQKLMDLIESIKKILKEKANKKNTHIDFDISTVKHANNEMDEFTTPKDQIIFSKNNKINSYNVKIKKYIKA